MKKLALLFLLPLTLLCSACAGKQTAAKPPEPVIIFPAQCARPQKPDLPKLGNVKFLESGSGYAVLKRRDRIMRDYIAGLEDALDCYEAQIPSLRKE